MLRRAVLLTSLLVVACGGGTQSSAASRTAAAAGDATRGKDVFTTVAQPACATCHLIQGVSDGQIGPELTHIGTVAGQRVSDPTYTGKAKDAAGYIRESIADPNAFIAPRCPAGACFKDVMPKDFAQKLTAGQLEDVIAYLAAQK